jgi:hypothetical protein
MSKTKTTVVTTLVLSGLCVILYHQHTPEVVEVAEYSPVIKPALTYEQIVHENTQTPDYDVVEEVVAEETISFGRAFLDARNEYGSEGTFTWNDNEYHTRVVEEEMQRILKEEFMAALDATQPEVLEDDSVVVDTVKVVPFATEETAVNE